MAFNQPKVESVVLGFVSRPRVASYLTSRDRMEIRGMEDQVRLSGYDRMVIHEVEPNDMHAIGDYLSLYRVGEAWSRWCFARTGTAVIAWCALTGADMGNFGSLSEAVEALLPGPSLTRPDPNPPGAVITHLAPYLSRPNRRLGSAA